MTKPVKIFLKIGIALLGLGFVVIVGGTVWGMIRAFHQLNGSGLTGPDQLGSSIAMALHSCVIGIPILTAGFLITVISLLVHFVAKLKSNPSS